MKISVNIGDLREVENKQSSAPKRNTKREVNLNLKRVATSIDLRGLDAEEAIYNVDKYLDEAYLVTLMK